MPVDPVLQALADPMRRAILERLREGPRALGEVARDLPVSRPAVSQHMRVLKEAGLVHERVEGRRHIYAIERGGLHEVRRYLESFWDDVLDAFARAADDPGGERAPESPRVDPSPRKKKERLR